MDNLVALQLTLESDAMAEGIGRYRKSRERQDETDLKPGREALRAACLPMAEALEADLEATEGGKARRGGQSVYAKYLPLFDPLVVAYITARTLINLVANSETSVTRAAMMISTLLHEHKLFSELREAQPNLFKHVEQRINNTVPERQRWAMNKAVRMAQETVKGIEWADQDKLLVGVRCISLFATHTGMIQERTINRNRRSRAILEPTDRLHEWLEAHHAALEMLEPMHQPMVIPPLPWTNPKDGGYLECRLDLVKVSNKDTIDELFSTKMPEVYDAVNSLQATPWAINAGVLKVLEVAWAEGAGLGGLPVAVGSRRPTRPDDIPANVPISALNAGQKRRLNAWRAEIAQCYTDEATATSKRLTVILQLAQAKRFAAWNFYFPYQLDFRGRIYAVPPMLNPQGDNVAKGLLRFAKGKPLGESGGYWLAVHIANEFGADKGSFDERVQWVLDHEEWILDSALDPLDGARFWTTADGGKKAWTALAACFEWAGFKLEGEDYVSHLPIGMDGSCSGLQHFSALLRDPVGAAATNLVASAAKADIYQVVATKVDAKLEGEMGAVWRDNVTRAIVKQPCMTFAYSSTIHGMRDQIVHALRKDDVDLGVGVDYFSAAMYLAPIVRACIEDTVVAASSALAWLQEVARIATEAGEPLVWHSPVGLPVVQASKRTTGSRVQAVYQGRRVMLTLQIVSRDLDRRAQVNGISPNYVHSMDAAHLMLTVNTAAENGITDFAMVHDSFGCHACDIDVLHKVIRTEFVDMYQTNWLEAFAADIQDQLKVPLPPLPAMGDFDVAEVMGSDFFFS